MCVSESVRGVTESSCAESGHWMSALPPIADIQIMIPGQAPANVRLTPKSGHKWLWRGMSAFDPKRTLVSLATYLTGCQTALIGAGVAGTTAFRSTTSREAFGQV